MVPSGISSAWAIQVHLSYSLRIYYSHMYRIILPWVLPTPDIWSLYHSFFNAINLLPNDLASTLFCFLEYHMIGALLPYINSPLLDSVVIRLVRQTLPTQWVCQVVRAYLVDYFSRQMDKIPSILVSQ